MTIYTDNFQIGLKFILNADPCNILEASFTKPGKGQAFTKVKYRNLKTGRVLDKTFKTGDKVEVADVLELKMQFLYQEGDQFIFMNLDNYEQVYVNKEIIGDKINWLIAQSHCSLILFNQEVIDLNLENHVNLKITYCEPGIKGDSATNSTKLATLETGAQIKVPLFIKQGDSIKIDTRTGSYLSRA